MKDIPFAFICPECSTRYSLQSKSYLDALANSFCTNCNAKYYIKNLERDMICSNEDCQHEHTYTGETYSDFTDLKCTECNSKMVRNDISGTAPTLVSQDLMKLQTPEWFDEKVSKMNSELRTDVKPLKH